jgi:serine/threonine-protein kinase
VTGTSAPGESARSSSAETLGRDAVAPVPTRTSRGASRLRGGSPLTWRLFLTVGAVVATVLVAALVMLSAAAARTADVASARALERTTRLVAVLLDGREHGLMRGAQVFVKNPSAWPLLMERRPEDVLDLAVEAADRVGASWVQITDDRGVRLAKSDEPTAAAVSLSSSALIGGALDGTATTGAGVTGDSMLFQAVAVPVVVGARVAGVLMAAQLVDSALAAQVKATTASDVVFYVTDTAGTPRIAASTLGRDPALVEMLRRVKAEGRDSLPADSSSPGGPITRADVALGGDHYVGRGATLRSAGGDVLGGFVALRSRAAEMAPYVALRRWIVFAGLLGLAVAFVLAFLTARSVARPVLALADATRRAADGDYSAVVDVDSNDEVGELASAVRTMLADLREKEALVAVIRTPRAVAPARVDAPAPVGASALASAPAGSTLGDHAAGVGSAGTPLPVGPGRVLARRYAIAEQLGIGGSGVVYRAFDRELGEVIAVKTVRPDVLAVDATALERLKSEIRLARRISHRNVVRTHDIGEEDGMYFITMEYVTGTSLRELIDRREPLPTPAVVAIAKQLCRALEVAHEQGVIHRDIKPQNLMVQPDGTLKVMDFGVARLRERSHGLTSTGMVVGTPAYMAPEQLMDDPVDARVDIYAAGVVLYECLTGHRPVDGSSPHVLMARMLSSNIRPPHEVNPSVPRLLSAIVMRTLSKEPGDRPASAGELYDLLSQVDET